MGAFDVLAVVVIASVCSLLAAVAAAVLVQRAKGPTAWQRKLQDLELALADLEERHDATRTQLAKWRGRQAQRLARSGGGDSEDSEESGAPDPVTNPAAWKQYVNAGNFPRRR